MGSEQQQRRRALASACKLAAVYLVISLAWILFSDAAVLMLTDDPEQLNRLQNAKGVAFVTVMALLLGLTVYRQVVSRIDSERANALMSTDPVTHLPNTLGFTEALSEAIAHRKPFSVIVLDVAGFAGLNATLGRERGDQILSVLAGRLRRLLADDHVVARLQADTFAVLTPANSEHASGLALAEGVVAGLGSDLRVGETPVQLKVTAGVSEFPQDGDSVARLMDAADIALQRTRLPGARGVARYDANWRKARTESFLLENELREALRRRQLGMVLQPQFDLVTGRLAGLEALARWTHPTQGEISPARFIPVAEASGLIDQISEFILDSVCRQLREWMDQGLAPVPVGVNIAGHQLGDLQLGVFVRDAAERHRVPFELLQIEITESLAVRDPERGIELLNALRELGVTIALDDFGTGYSSLKYLLELPVDVLKIDRSFVADVHGSEHRRRFVKVIVDLARDLGIRTIAEGVETREQKARLQELGCDIAQGYLLGRPMAAHAVRELLHDVHVARDHAGEQRSMRFGR